MICPDCVIHTLVAIAVFSSQALTSNVPKFKIETALKNIVMMINVKEEMSCSLHASNGQYANNSMPAQLALELMLRHAIPIVLVNYMEYVNLDVWQQQGFNVGFGFPALDVVIRSVKML